MNAPYATLPELQTWATAQMQRRPDLIIGKPTYLRRWWIVPRNEQQNVYLHQGLRDDDDRALHDHPWDNASFLLVGRYREITPHGTFVREAGSLIHRKATDAHRLELVDGQPFVSLFFTGPKVREWGFLCPKGWVHWQDFTAGEHGELVGAGCGE
ncbi:hypothetical protein DFR49_3390 [Hephaestia caeni]|uniref:Cupin domain-containing protein n=1 Tax=Hephaestia caeni TaxID=645617 RepID=A0A397NS19_9SPHN|nr:hypothetical protein [Hephaestia caeni]RIA37505.1 hypothetical protein DFR49_3390 [Hephaestia caeni]